ADTAPDDFKFSVKAWQFATAKRDLAEGAPLIEKFLTSGFTELKSKLGPVFWQFTPTRKFDEENFETFFSLLPKERDGFALKHVIEVRHESFLVPEFIKLCRKHSVGIVLVDSDKHPLIADVTSDVVYMRLQRTNEKIATGYPPKAIAEWAKRARTYEA